MRAWYTGSGMRITLNLRDKQEGDSIKRLECMMEPQTKLVLHIMKKVPWKAMLEEPGFHVVGVPRATPPERRKRHDVYLSKDNWKRLTNPTGNPIIDGGYICSRGRFDRTDITYFAV